MSTAAERLHDRALRWLAEHPDAPLRDRAAIAVVVVAKGDPDSEVSFDEVARCAGMEKHEARQALLSAREHQELVDEDEGASTTVSGGAGCRSRATKHGRRPR